MSYVVFQETDALPRLPLEGSLDLTYRCNNTCRHCWLWLPQNAPEQREELTFEEIRRIADEARSLGCRKWNISGGEPMLRPEFAEIFEYLTSRAVTYNLNTNGTLITPAIAQLLKRKGRKMVALYGATAEVYDHVTRHPGGFELAMQGIRYLQEAGAGFIVQLIPMRSNWHQWDEMVKLAESLSPHWRIGASWLYLSASGSAKRNAEIAAERLEAATAVRLDRPVPEGADGDRPDCDGAGQGDDRLLARCIGGGSGFHIDPYGRMSLCSFATDPRLRYDLRGGSFRQGWDEFIPSLAEQVRGGEEYGQNCGGCENRRECNWCAVHGRREEGRYSAPVPYLCELARERTAFRQQWQERHRRYYQVAGLTLQVDSDLPFEADTLDVRFEPFRVERPGQDVIRILHSSEFFGIDGRDLGTEVHRQPPWAVSHKGRQWTYLCIGSGDNGSRPNCMARVDDAYSRILVERDSPSLFRAGGLQALTMLPSDWLLLAHALARREAFLMHASGLVMDGAGLLCVGHSGAGKSTIAKLLRGRADLLCDDRIVVRRWPEGFRIHGTWSHGELPEVSSASAPLRAVLFLEKASECRLAAATESQALTHLLACLVLPMITSDWWRATAPVVNTVARTVPCFEMRFDRSGAIVPLLESLVRG